MLFAVLLQVFLPFGQALPVPSSQGPRNLVLCTTMGLRVIPAGPIDSQQPKAGDPGTCPVCQAVAFGAALLRPPPVAIPLPGELVLAQTALPEITAPAFQRGWQPFLPRGPPAA